MNIMDIKNPDFIKDLDNKELDNLSKDIRKYIIENVSKTGGHLSSNLGVIELTIALLKVFDYKKDKIIFDVGHQSYTYKILTGRAKDFASLRKKNGLSGFQSCKESVYDIYDAGHSSTSISAGLGFAIARDLKKNDYNVISIIGDGSISNGLAYEALNHLGDKQTKQIIILNDNQMSISKNVGAIHNLLDQIRSSKGYNKTKINTKEVLSKSKIGNHLKNNIKSIKSLFKKIYLRNANIFDEFGLEYYGPINGHDYKELIKYLNIAKNEDKPVILHVITEKGKGYKYSEEDKIGKFHGIDSFNIETGELLNKNNLPSYSEIISSYVYNYAKKNKDIICITPGMCFGSRLDIIKEKLPDQFIDVGIAEEHAITLASGLAKAGMKPFVFIYSTFMQRAYDQILHDIARMNNDVTILIDRAGLIPSDGETHQGVFDIPMLLSMPNIIISAPKNPSEANDLIYTSIKSDKPFAIRYNKINLKSDFEKTRELEIGSWELINKGNDGYLITYGDFVNNAIIINNKLNEDNINLSIINARFIKPYDKKMFESILKDNKPIFIYEESTILGSLGSELMLNDKLSSFNSIVKIYGIKDEFLTHATRDELIEMQELDIESIYEKIKKTLE